MSKIIQVRNKAMLSFLLMYNKQSLIQMFSIKWAEESFFLSFFEWSHAEIGLKGEHIAPVSSCSGQQSTSVVRYISLHPPSILLADMHT